MKNFVFQIFIKDIHAGQFLSISVQEIKFYYNILSMSKGIIIIFHEV